MVPDAATRLARRSLRAPVWPSRLPTVALKIQVPSMAFAPGKVLLFGEHSVVYGHPAIACAIDGGIEASALPGPARLICADWELDARPGDGSRVGAALAALVSALPFDAATVRLEPSIPPGAGLGSSASMAVATARALGSLHGVALDGQELVAAAEASERVFHGNPSGLDHTTVIRGGLIHFRRTPTGNVVRPVPRPTPLPLVVALVEPGADTGVMVEGVAEQRGRLGAIASGIHDQIGAIADAAFHALAAADDRLVGELMNVNHYLLGALGVSTPPLDAAASVARRAGALGAKLTGAGGGGAIVALTPHCSAVVAEALQSAGATIVVGGDQ